MKAIEILNSYWESCLRLSEQSNKKARFELSEGNIKEAEYHKLSADRSLNSAKEIQDAIEEINHLKKMVDFEEMKVIEEETLNVDEVFPETDEPMEVDFERNLPDFLEEDELGFIQINQTFDGVVDDAWNEWLTKNNISL